MTTKGAGAVTPTPPMVYRKDTLTKEGFARGFSPHPCGYDYSAIRVSTPLSRLTPGRAAR